MIRPLIALLLVTAVTAACERDAGPTVVISDVRILAPLTSASAGVAYLTITNEGTDAVTVSGVRSPQFERIEIHETLNDEQGVSRMNPRATVTIDPGDSVGFTEGALHLMLMSPRPNTRAGTPVTLELEVNDGLLIVSATLQNRLPAD